MRRLLIYAYYIFFPGSRGSSSCSSSGGSATRARFGELPCSSPVLLRFCTALSSLLFCSAMVLSHFETKTEPQARLFSRPLSISARPLHWEVCGGGLQHPAPPTFLVAVAHGAQISVETIAICPRGHGEIDGPSDFQDGEFFRRD